MISQPPVWRYSPVVLANVWVSLILSGPGGKT
jgi:hypothetical protein